MSVVKEIAKRLKAARKAAGFKSAKEFASIHTIPFSTYAQHEGGTRSICAELIITYSMQLQINPYWLLTGNGNAFLGSVDQTKVKALKDEAYSPPDVSQKLKDLSLIDLELLKKIFIASEFLFNDNSIKLSFPELIDYCFDLYNVIATLSADMEEKEKIISLTMSSLKRGSDHSVPKQQENF